MKVEIWSDIVCPFCYIGKQRFEKALRQFPDNAHVEVIWRSYQLDPDLQPADGQTVNEYLAERKGIKVEAAAEMNEKMGKLAKEESLAFDLEQAVVTNTMDAHRLLHLANKHAVQNEVKEKLFEAYYAEGRDLNDHETLADIGASTGLGADEIREMLAGDKYRDAVRLEHFLASSLGANGVPFFVFNNKYAVGGAQSTEVFLNALKKAREEEITAYDQLNAQEMDTTDNIQ